jgi:hypothetical protein
MKDKIYKTFFSLQGLSITIGVCGFLSSVVTLFVDVNSQVSIKILLFTVLLFSCFIFILFKINFDLYSENNLHGFYENPIKFIEKDLLFIIKKNNNFRNSIMLGCYSQIDGVETLAYLAYVYLEQEKVLQVKIDKDFGVLANFPINSNDLKNIVIRPGIPTMALTDYTFQGQVI